MIYLIGGRTDGNFTTHKVYQLHQVNKEDGKHMDIKKLASMISSRAYHAARLLTYKDSKYIIAVGGQQTRISPKLASLTKDSSDTMSVSSADIELDCEIYDIARDKWIALPNLNTKKSSMTICQMSDSSIVYSFGGWTGTKSTNEIERVDISSYTTADDKFDVMSAKDEEIKFTPSPGFDKAHSEGGKKKPILGNWDMVIVKQAGTIGATPDMTLFNSANSMGCVCLDDTCILIFGGKKNLKDGETDMCYLFFGSNRVRSANSNDYVYEMQRWDKKLSMGDSFGDGSFWRQKNEGQLFALSDTCFIHYLDFTEEQWQLKKI
jgi:hypothetical protein